MSEGYEQWRSDAAASQGDEYTPGQSYEHGYVRGSEDAEARIVAWLRSEAGEWEAVARSSQILGDSAKYATASMIANELSLKATAIENGEHEGTNDE